MRFSTSVLLLVAAFGLVLIPACGGGGQGLRLPAADPLAIGTALPQLQSGDTVDFEIPIGGGCGGPYVIEVIGGLLPDGIGIDTDNGRHHLVGVLLEDGSFPFTLKVTDTNCVPFSTNTAAFTWDVGQGPVRIVMAQPEIIPNAQFNDPNKYMDSWGPDGQSGTADDNTPGFTIDALETVVYGSSTVINLIPAGGVPPYTCSIVDDPNDPNDDLGLPTPTAFAVNSCSIIGTPIQVLPGGLPFRFTVRVTDGAGSFSDRKFQWKVDTPPIIQANTGLADGTAGSDYADIITVVDGVPPIAHEFIDELPTDNGTVDPLYLGGIQYVPGSVPVVPQTRGGLTVQFLPTGSTDVGVVADSARLEPIAGRTQYPPENDNSGTYGPYPSEGMYIVDETQGAGSVLGIPRRFGDFEVIAHSYSTLVPNERGQHAIKALEFTIAPADPVVVIEPTWTVEQAWPAPPDLATVPEMEIGQAWDPDNDGNPGLQLVASGGVYADGYFDNPHSSERGLDPSETEGFYDWRDDWLPSNPTPWDGPPSGVGFTPAGLLSVTNSLALVRTGKRPVLFNVRDYMLPSQNRGEDQRTVNYSVGPDLAIITVSSTSDSGQLYYWAGTSPFRMHDVNMTVQKFELFSGGPQRGPLTDLEMVANHGIPGIAGVSGPNQLGALLSGVTNITGYGATGGGSVLDLIRGVVNATGWWDDLFAFNPRGARPFTHADACRNGFQEAGNYSYDYWYHGGLEPDSTAIDLPDAPSVSHDPDNGVYNNGGYLYHFESTAQYGLFIVRPDAKVYVPFADKKVSNKGFGDGVMHSRTSNTSLDSVLRTVQMTVSPDGRIGAMKLKSDQYNLFQHADSSDILLVSLTGEKLFNGGTSTYRIVDVPATTLTGSGNRILYASSLALTNNHLYFLIGTQSPSSNTDTSSTRRYYQPWRGHFLMRCEVLTGAVQKLPGPASDSNWTQDDFQSSTMQTAFHHHGPNQSSSSSYWGLKDSQGYPYYYMYHQDGMNFHELNVAPTPFRVSADGTTVAFPAGPDTTSYSSSNTYKNYVWVDRNGAGAKRITGTRRGLVAPGGRGYTLYYGVNSPSTFGRYTGPTPGLEISDNGLAVAFVYHDTDYTSTISGSGGSGWYRNRENVLLTTSTDGNWTSYDEEEVTDKTFTGSHIWRFGALAFSTPDGSGSSAALVFWGGAPNYRSTYYSSSYHNTRHLHGSFYYHVIGNTNKVTHMLAVANGGHSGGANKDYTSSLPFNPSSTSGVNNRFGAIHPYGGFLSRNRKFMYVYTPDAISSSDNTGGKLLGLNISDGTINGHPSRQGFVPSNWPSRRGFLRSMSYYYYAHDYIYDDGRSPSKGHGQGGQVMAKDSGWVFFSSNYQYSSTTSSGSTSYGRWVFPTAYSYGYGYGGAATYGFNPDVGGAIARLHGNWATNSTSSTYWGTPKYLETNREGTRLALLTTAYYYYYYLDYERLYWMNNIEFDSNTGALVGYSTSANTGAFQNSNSRGGEAMAVVNDGRDIYYAWGTSNENQKQIIRQRWDETSGTWQKTTDSTNPNRRMNVLYAGR